MTLARTGKAESKQVKGAQTAIAILKGAATGAAVGNVVPVLGIPL